MMRIAVAFALTLAATAPAQAARSDSYSPTGKQFVEQCERSGLDYCEGLVDGLEDSNLNDIIRLRCMPAIKPPGARYAPYVVSWIKGHPEYLDKPVRDALFRLSRVACGQLKD